MVALKEFAENSWLPDWQDASQYPDPVKTSSKQWAWEFLRRNKKYQKLWGELIAPHVQNGRFDEDAAMHSLDEEIRNDLGIREALAEGRPIEIRKESPSILFEKIFGIRTMHSHPPSPSESLTPSLSFIDQWLESERGPTPEYKMKVPRRALKQNEVAIYFNLELPLPAQIKRANRQLEMIQQNLKAAGKIDLPVKYGRDGRFYQRYLRLLDGEANHATHSEMLKKIDFGNTDKTLSAIGKSLAAAVLLRDRDYRFIVMNNSKNSGGKKLPINFAISIAEP